MEQAQAIRAGMQALARTAPDAVLLAQPMAVYDEWSAESVEYVLDDIRQYNGLLYRCVQAHTSQATWTPEDAPSLWTRIADPALLVRRLNLTACRIGPADQAGRSVQLSFFDGEDAARRAAERREERRQRAVLAIREKYGGNAIFRGADLLEGATGLSRNAQIGGHRA